jgi:hypothetical protein
MTTTQPLNSSENTPRKIPIEAQRITGVRNDKREILGQSPLVNPEQNSCEITIL